MESYTLELHPERPIHFALFQNVTNAKELHQRFISHDQSLGLCLINAHMVYNKFHLLLAANRAIHDEQTTRIKSINIYSEIAFGFSMTTSIGKTLTQFGINQNTTDMIVIRIGSQDTKEAEEYIKQHIQGDLVDFDHLSNVRDIDQIKKVYAIDTKLTNEDTIMSLVTTAIALRGH